MTTNNKAYKIAQTNLRKNCHNTTPQENGFYSSRTSFGIFYFHLLTDFLGFIFTSLVKMAFALLKVHIVFYFTTHRSFVFYYTTLSGFCILVLRWVCHTVLKVFWRLVCCVVVQGKNGLLFYHMQQNSFYYAALLQYLLRLSLFHKTHMILTFILPHE